MKKIKEELYYILFEVLDGVLERVLETFSL